MQKQIQPIQATETEADVVEVDDLLCKQLDRIEDRTESNGKAIGELQKDVATIKGRNYATTDQVSAMSKIFDAAIDSHARECKEIAPRASVLPSVPIKRFDGKIRVDLILVAKIIGLIISMVAAAAGYDIAFR